MSRRMPRAPRKSETILGVIREVVKRPYKFFRGVSSHKGMHKSLFFFTIYALFVSLFGSLTAYVAYPRLFQDLYYLFNITLNNYASSFVISYYLFAIIELILGLFVLVCIAHLFLKLFHSKGKFYQTFNVFAYSYAPGFVMTPLILLLQSGYYVSQSFLFLGLSLIASAAFLVYVLWLQVVGISIAHKIPKKRAFVIMYVIPLLLLIALSLVLVFFSPTLGVSFSTARL
jgi:hypothetical protein